MEDQNNKKPAVSQNKEANYAYWDKKDVEFYKGVDKPNTAPKKITPNEVPQQKTVGSTWNRVGTWEQKHYDTKELFAFVQGREIRFGDDDEYRVSKISKIQGEVSCVVTRGKRKVGYELQMEIEVERGTQFVTVKFDEFNEYDEHEYQICVGTLPKSELNDVFDEMSEALKNVIIAYIDSKE